MDDEKPKNSHGLIIPGLTYLTMLNKIVHLLCIFAYVLKNTKYAVSGSMTARRINQSIFWESLRIIQNLWESDSQKRYLKHRKDFVNISHILIEVLLNETS